MNTTAKEFYDINEPYAGGFFENPERSRFYRFSIAQKRYWENVTITEYKGGLLFPNGIKFNYEYAVRPSYSYVFEVNFEKMIKKSERLEKVIREERNLVPTIDSPHTVGGAGYTHSFPNYKRIIKEGFNSYIARIEKIKDKDIREGLLEVVGGIQIFRDRLLKELEDKNAPDKLSNALKKVPFEPADNLYEALVAWNFIYYIDGCDNPGQLDKELIEYYNGEDVTDILHELFQNVNANDGWTGSVGPDYNELSLQCLKAIKGVRRPNLELKVTDNMPDELWEAAAESLITGCGQPAFYNEKLYQKKLREMFEDIPQKDLDCFCGGGCTETMIAGLSNVGSLDAGINAALIFADFMHKKLGDFDTFEDFYQELIRENDEVITTALDKVNIFRMQRALFRPHVVRTLLIDDCIDKGVDYNGGGARYNWSVINVAGLINVIDSLISIKKLVYDEKKYTPCDFIKKLCENDAALASDIKNLKCYGVDDDDADFIAKRYAKDIFDIISSKPVYMGRRFLPSSIQFTTYTEAGKVVAATPDGRRSGDALCDSIAALSGKDTEGVTAMLKSAAKLPQTDAPGTLVLNIRLEKKYLKDYIKPLILGYFAEGGMQAQVSCISREDMLDAMVNPQNHENLMVRTGGYSEYFNKLSDELKRTIIARTEYM